MDPHSADGWGNFRGGNDIIPRVEEGKGWGRGAEDISLSTNVLDGETREGKKGRAAVASPDIDVVYGSFTSASKCADRALVASGGTHKSKCSRKQSRRRQTQTDRGGVRTRAHAVLIRQCRGNLHQILVLRPDLFIRCSGICSQQRGQ